MTTIEAIEKSKDYNRPYFQGVKLVSKRDTTTLIPTPLQEADSFLYIKPGRTSVLETSKELENTVIFHGKVLPRLKLVK